MRLLLGRVKKTLFPIHKALPNTDIKPWENKSRPAVIRIYPVSKKSAKSNNILLHTLRGTFSGAIVVIYVTSIRAERFIASHFLMTLFDSAPHFPHIIDSRGKECLMKNRAT